MAIGAGLAGRGEKEGAAVVGPGTGVGVEGLGEGLRIEIGSDDDGTAVLGLGGVKTGAGGGVRTGAEMVGDLGALGEGEPIGGGKG